MTGRVLVIDSSVESAVLTKAHLRRDYLEVVTARNGREALTELETETDLVVLDPALKGADGFDVCREIKSDQVGS